MSLSDRIWFVVCAAPFVSSAAQAFTPTEEASTFEIPLAIETISPAAEFVPLAATAEAFATLGEGWYVQPNLATGTVHIGYGGANTASGIALNEESAVELAREFLLRHRTATGATPANLILRRVAHARGKWAVHFGEVANQISVYGANAFVVLGDEGQIMAFGSDFVPAGDVSSRPSLTENQAIALAADALSTAPSTDSPALAELFWVPEPFETTFALRLAYRVRFSADTPFGDWESWVDAGTGEIFGRRNRIDLVNVIGTVQGGVQDFSYCNGEATKPLANLTVNVTGVGSDATDASGAFVVSNPGTGQVQVSAQLLGPYLNVNRFSGLGADASFVANNIPGNPLTINFTDGNARQDERDCFFHANRAHDFVKVIEPTFTGLDFSMVCVVGRTDGFCPGNAWWSPGSSSINFCQAGAGYANTGEIGNVVYHEYGHGVNDFLYAAHGSSIPFGDMHEGNADIIANFIERDPIIGRGFFQDNCLSGIRNSDNNLQWPSDNDGGHFGGQIIAGFYWDSWQSLLAVKPQAEADDIAWNGWHFSRALGTPQTQSDQVFWTFVADDDDANLTNGTPNHEHWCAGATNHNFDCPAITAGVFITHEKLTNTEDGTQGFDVVAVIVSTEALLDAGSLLVDYRVNGGGFTQLLMTPTGNQDEYSGHIPPLSQFSEVEYFISAADLDGNTKTSPEEAPSVLYAFDVALDVEDFESGTGAWTIGAPGDNATQGIWALIDPVGTVAQPEDDATPTPGTMAFVTGQCGPGFGSCTTSCSPTISRFCNDVDGGKTTLLSPVYDLTGASQAKIKYDRWYSNNTGGSPGIDHWIVDVSNNGGASWVNVEDTTTSAAAWQSQAIDINALFGTPNQVRVRYVAQDLGNDSVVEAGVDEFRILADVGSTGITDLVQDATPIFSLSQSEPNPFDRETRIEYSVPARTAVELTVYNVTGRVVRKLDAGPRDAGRYRVSWDGRDWTGSRVAAGVYFYKLTANEKSLTRKMTVLQ
jgi:hypothetical protein